MFVCIDVCMYVYFIGEIFICNLHIWWHFACVRVSFFHSTLFYPIVNSKLLISVNMSLSYIFGIMWLLSLMMMLMLLPHQFLLLLMKSTLRHFNCIQLSLHLITNTYAYIKIIVIVYMLHFTDSICRLMSC